MKFGYIEYGKGILETVRRYLPSNYEAEYWPNTDVIIIKGEDVAGWTMDDYVIPRLASGLYTVRRAY